MIHLSLVKQRLIKKMGISNDTTEDKKIPIDEFQSLFRVAFYITCHSLQGETYDHPYTIWEFERFSSKMKYVALSRTTKKQFVNIIFFFGNRIGNRIIYLISQYNIWF
jgi:hypothetical protein